MGYNWVRLSLLPAYFPLVSQFRFSENMGNGGLTFTKAAPVRSTIAWSREHTGDSSLGHSNTSWCRCNTLSSHH